MKSLQYIIQEALVKKHIPSGWNNSEYKYFPTSKDELKEIIKKRINDEGLECDLNDIDTSKITDMSDIFGSIDFDGNISNWNVSNVINMDSMFLHSNFTGKNSNLSNWNTSKVITMRYMFGRCQYNKDELNNWDVSHVKKFTGMFWNSKFNQDLSNWDVSNGFFFNYMFQYSDYNKNLHNWKINKAARCVDMFNKCPLSHKKTFKPQLV